MIQLPIFAAVPPVCQQGSFFGFPHWYQYLRLNSDCSPSLANINDIWLIVAAVIEILLRVAALAAVAFVIYGGVSYVMSQGEPEKITRARTTVVDALIGLTISVIAATIVAFVAGGFTK